MVRGKLENPFKCPPNMFKILIYGWRVEIGLNDFVQQVECVPAREGGGRERWQRDIAKFHKVRRRPLLGPSPGSSESIKTLC